MKKLQAIERYTKKPLRKRQIPTIEKVNEIKQDKFIRDIESNIANGITEDYSYIINRLYDSGNSPEAIISALIKDRLTFDSSENDKDLNDIIPERRKSSRNRDEDINKSGVRFFLNLGKKDGIRPRDILGAVAGECDIPGTDIGEIEILDKFSFFNAAKEHKNVILKKMNDSAIKGKDVVVELTTSKKQKGSVANSKYGSDSSKRKDSSKSSYRKKK